MTGDDALDILAERIGVIPRFRDLDRVERSTSPDTKRALLRANGLNVDSDAEVRETLAELRAKDAKRIAPREMIVTRGAATSLPLAEGAVWRVECEGAGEVLAEGVSDGAVALPPLPSGVHRLIAGENETVSLIAAPPRAPSIADLTGAAKTWGVVAALYGLRSDRNAGLGDYADLGELAATLGPLGAGFLGVNPLHALGWADRETISPYSPTHRGFLNTSHIAMDRIPGGGASSPANTGDRIDYAAHNRWRRPALQAAFAGFCETAGFDRFCAASGKALDDFALFEALSEDHGPDWRTWPVDLRDASAAHRRADDGMADRVRFHKWLQWLADDQLSAAQSRAKQAGMSLGLYLDLAVGARRGGAETWGDAAVAKGVSLGAPPDHLAPNGQNWNLATYAPLGLIRDRYRGFRQILSQSLKHAGLLRIDHALGLNRSYWIPDDGSPGGYIRQPFRSLLAVIAIEAERAGAAIVGEDLGLVPPEFRRTMQASGLYGYSVLQYEKDRTGRFNDPEKLRPQTLANFGTHDTPTLRGFWEGRDIDWWRKLGWIDEPAEAKARARRSQEKLDLLGLGLPERPLDLGGFGPRDLKERAHRVLADAPSAMVAVQLDDILDEVEAQNLPGTVDEHPNWTRRCRVAVDAFGDHAELRAVGEQMTRAGRGPSGSDDGKDEG